MIIIMMVLIVMMMVMMMMIMVMIMIMMMVMMMMMIIVMVKAVDDTLCNIIYICELIMSLRTYTIVFLFAVELTECMNWSCVLKLSVP